MMKRRFAAGHWLRSYRKTVRIREVARVGFVACCIPILILAVGCRKPQAETKAEAFDWDLSREAFLEEVLFGVGCARTPRFDDYTPGSYHVGLLDLVAGVREKRGQRADGPNFMGVISHGPSGALWTYEVIGIVEFVDGSPFVTINHLRIAHARITLKQTKHMEKKDVLTILAAFDSIKFLKRGDPLKEGGDEPFFISVDWLSGRERTFFAKESDLREEEKVAELNKQLSSLMDGSTVTYVHSPAGGIPFTKLKP